MKVEKSILREMCWDDCPEGWEVLDNEVTGSGRWSEYHTMVFRMIGDDRCWAVNYSVGLTEMQDERPFENEPDMVEVFEVKPVEKVIIEYVRV
ncbi:hypothetical protein F485_gp206 [Aeromonas phage CC2]|uniref:Uncharacterized protein n=1 Tax=Aeromonas phage CC2 TaxID=1204516 RepID=I6XL29_9CAUD|nr:hypothetical protein F485_gp206 [Aeromonas phage CC2]AFN39214.1 hypothetical protein CC2_089 [Aeromonas phage CC2]